MEREDLGTGLICGGGVDGDDASVGLAVAFPDFEDFGSGLEGVSVEDGVGVAQVGGGQVGDCLAGDGWDRPAEDARVGDRAGDSSLA